MTYDHLLLDDERVVLETRRHLIVLSGPILVATAGIVIAFLLGTVITPGSTRDVVDLAVGIASIALVLRALARIWAWSVQRVIVTNRRMIRISGVLTRKVGSIPLKRMTDLTFHRGLWGRVLGYGDLVVESAGQEAGRYRLDHLPRPNDFYRVLSSRVAPATTLPVPDPVMPEDQQDTGPLPRVIV